MYTGPRWAITGIFFLLLIRGLEWSAAFLTPVTAAVLGYLMVGPLRRRLARLGVSAAVTATVVTVGLSLGIGYAMLTLAQPTADLIDDLPQLISNLSHEFSGRGGTIEKLNEAAAVAQEVLTPVPAKDVVEVKVIEPGNYFAQIVSQTPAIVGQAIFALCLLFFLISSGDLFVVKLVESFDRFKDKKNAVAVVRLVESRLGHYLGSIVMINAGLGVAVALAMMIWGVPNPLMFGLVAFSLNFIPFLGAIGGSTLAGLAAFAAFHELWPTIGVFATYMALTSIEGQFVTPKLLSDRLQLNTPVVFLAVAFFAWIWSVIGMIVAVPILIVIKIVLDEIEFDEEVRLVSGRHDRHRLLTGAPPDLLPAPHRSAPAGRRTEANEIRHDAS